MYKSIMVYVDPAGGAPAKLVGLAAGLAVRFSASLIGCSAIAMRPPVAVEGIVLGEVTEALIGEIRAKLKSRGAWFRRNAAGIAPQEVQWRSEMDFPDFVVTREARAADLLIVPRTASVRDAYTALDTAAVVLRAGRPVLVVPESQETLRAEHVIVGWKDTREARRAIVDALPFLHGAARVSIVAITEEADEKTSASAVSDVIAWLAHHRIEAAPVTVVHRVGSGAAELIRHAEAEGADLIVTGAWGHSRLGEWVFGGMTRELLHGSPVCCLMSH